jgi:hypothetical protein
MPDLAKFSMTYQKRRKEVQHEFQSLDAAIAALRNLKDEM